MPVQACRFIRKLRGGAQAHLLQANDGHFYVVKFQNNPQHRRILINEWIGSAVLRYLQISTPVTAIVDLTPGFLEQHPDLHLQLGSRRVPVDPGWHFGSRFPGDPARLAVYDFLPDALLERVANLKEFLATFVADKWLGNADARQSIFFRARLRESLPVATPINTGASNPGATGERAGFVAQMMDHGYVFDGPHWAFHDSPLHGLYFRPLVYAPVRSINDFQPWLDRVLHFPEEVLDDALRQIPLAWVNGDTDALEALLEKLVERRRKVPELIEAARHGRAGAFSNWT